MNILRLSCPDRSGIVAAVAGCLHQNQCNIEEAAEFHEPNDNHFYMRIIFSGEADALQDDFKQIATDFSMDWHVCPKDKPIRTLILVSQWDHCLNDILYRSGAGHLNIDITGVMSNHDTARKMVEDKGLPFHYLPLTPTSKAQQETQMSALIAETNTELLLLARYMQILSPEFCDTYTGKMINIHHSFLPGFKGAKPYAQAYARGVKMIGATAHFVTSDLDEGPIIAQNAEAIDHTYTPEKMQALGRDIEAKTLAKAVKLYTERRIFLHNRRTVIL